MFDLNIGMEISNLKILFVEDDDLTRQVTRRVLSKYGKVVPVNNYISALNFLDKESFDVAFFDLNLHGELSGLDLVKYAKSKGLYSIVVSGETENNTIENAFLGGAIDYLLKPFNDEKLQNVMNRYFNNKRHLDFENIINKNFITKSQKQLDELYKLKNITISDKPIFIQGETGTGKRVVSHIIKKISGCDNFVEVNCSQFSDELIASELFGHKKGAFTGAGQDKIGLLEKANGGIVFLDEIHALSMKAQKTLLKALEEKEFYPVGGNDLVKSDFRIISATCEDIQLLISRGLFREDLFARISTFHISLLPLRERREDIDLLFQYYIQKSLIQIFINDSAKEILKQYSWPRNTRELQDLVENWVVNGNRLITPDVLPTHIRHNLSHEVKLIPDLYLDMIEEYGLSDFLKFLKKEIAKEVIKRNQGSMRKAAEQMKTSHSQLSAFLKKNKDLNLREGERR